MAKKKKRKLSDKETRKKKRPPIRVPKKPKTKPKKQSQRNKASRKGWETRKKRRAEPESLSDAKKELQKAREETERLQQRLWAEEQWRRYYESEFREVAQAKKELVELFTRVETDEERTRRMHLMWREVDGLVATPKAGRYIQILAWIQRNMFDPKEFWGEYRRRKT